MRLKKWICLALMAALCLFACAHAAEGDRNFARGADIFRELSDYPRGGCVAGDALYLHGYSHIFSYHTGDDDLAAAAYTLPSAGENEARELVRLFANGDALCALVSVVRLEEGAYGPVRLEIAEVEIDGGEARFSELAEAGVEGLAVSYGGDSSELATISGAVCAGGRLFLHVSGDSENGRIYALNLDGGEGDFLDAEHVRGVSVWEDDCLLIETYDYGSQRLEFWIYDPATDSLTEACAPAQTDSAPTGIAYSRETGRLFYMKDGYVMAATDFDFGGAQPVAEMFVRYSYEAESMLLDGDYYVCCGYYDGTNIRSTAPEALPGTLLTVQSAGVNDVQMNAYYDFNASHDGAAVVLKEDYREDSAIIEAMMGRDSSVDVYILSVGTEAFDALYRRGYMVELDAEEIAAAVEGMYPAIRDALTREGKIIAVPAMLYGWTLGLDYEGFERIGIPRERIPTDWSGFLDLLPELPALLPEDGSVRLFADYYTQRQVRMELVNGILESWHRYLNAAGEEVHYDVPELRDALEKVMALDLEAMGLPAGDEDDPYVMITVVGGGGDRTYTLINPDAGCTIGSRSGNSEPALLSVIPGKASPVPLGLTVAVVNPFSENADLAQEYLAALYRNLDIYTLYNLSARLNEPVRNRYYRQNVDNVQADIESARGELAAADPVDAPMWEERIALLEEQLETIEEYGWDISPEEIAWYRAHDSELFVSRYNYVNVAYESGEFSDLVQQFLAGRVDADAFLQELDRRVRMKAREEN